jgi:homoserine kinase
MFVEGQMYEVRVPATTANLGPGFDSFGLALSLFLRIRFRLAAATKISFAGEQLSSLPANKGNLIYRSIQHLFKLEGKAVPELELIINSEIPLARGLGSSGSAIVGGLYVANFLLGEPYTREQLFRIAVELEGHSDNVGASMFGGFVVTTYDGVKDAEVVKLPFPEQLKIVLLIPDEHFSTKAARGLIPEQIPLADVSYNIGHASLLLAYLMTGEIDKLSIAMRDQVHQPYRAAGVKGLGRAIKLATESGHFSAALSGAGSTILFFTTTEYLPEVYQTVELIMAKEEISGQIVTVNYQEQGVMLVEGVR